MNAATADHHCQPFAGLPGDDPDFPVIFQNLPWCWSPAVGFHRAGRPHEPRPVRAATRGAVYVTNGSIGLWQAFRLGLGVGTSNITAGNPPASEVLTRPLEACESWDGDLDPIAWYGYRCRDLDYIDHDAPARREVYRTAAGSFLPGGFGRWDELLDQALRQTRDPRAAAWAAPRASDGYRRLTAIDWNPRHRHFQAALLDYAAGTVYTNLTGNAVEHGVFRSLARLFGLTSPDQTRIINWLLLIARTVRQHAPNEPTSTRRLRSVKVNQ